MSDDITKPLTTAELLGRFYKELLEAGITTDLAHCLTLAAGKSQLEDGIAVRKVA